MIQDRLTIGEICDAIRDTLADAPALVQAQSYDQLTESIPDTPLIQVYFTTSNVDSATDTDRTTFKAEVRRAIYTFSVDVYAKRRADLKEDTALAVRVLDQLEAILEAQDECPPFGLTGIKGYRWATTFAPQLYADNAEYAGGVIELTLFFH